MKVLYCDLCMTPLKENNTWMLYIASPTNNRGGDFEEPAEYYNYLQKVQKEVKEICPTCKHIFDKMFELRLQKLSELTDEIKYDFSLKAKQNPKERKNGKEKK